ncbi:CUB domain protein, partial [Ostertagia ostertagi]
MHATTAVAGSADLMMAYPHRGDVPSYNITYKELLEDPCYCNSTDVVVGEKPVYVTSPGFPDLYCPNFRCKRRFLHSTREDFHYNFVVTVHFLSTENADFLEFSSGGLTVERLSGTHENVRLIITDDILETEFVTDAEIALHGYNMTIQSIGIPTGAQFYCKLTSIA